MKPEQSFADWVQSLQVQSIAVVGAGGKSTVLRVLARDLPRPVWLTTTTHLGSEQVNLAPRHMVGLPSLSELPELGLGSVLYTGTKDPAGKWTALPNDALETLWGYSKVCSATLVIEADGSKGRPLKAPAAYEPAIPAWVEGVLVVAGLSGLGKPLNHRTVHRPEFFSALSGLKEGEIITLAHLSRVLSSKGGGRKNIPAAARSAVVLNQRDAAGLSDEELAELKTSLIKAGFVSVWSGSLLRELEASG